MTDPIAEAHSTLMMQLKDATSEHHRRAEGRQLQRDLVAGKLAREIYGDYLGELLHVHRGLETRLAELAPSHEALAGVFQEHQRRESDLLADLKFYGRRPGPANEATRSFLSDLDRWAKENPAALLGALYVLEGSMNGNRFIARALSREWSLEPGAGLRYLDPYGDDQPETWAAFREDMNAQSFDRGEQAAIVAAAQRTFDALGEISDAVYGVA